MPDWSYNTIFKPILFKLPAAAARDAVFKLMRALSILPLGRQVFSFMTSEVPEPAIAPELTGLKFPSPVSFGPGFNLPGSMLRVLDTFNFGMLELGPVTRSSSGNWSALKRLPDEFGVENIDAPISEGLDAFVRSLPQKAPAVPVFVRVTFLPNTSFHEALAQLKDIVTALPHWTSGVTIDTTYIRARNSQPDAAFISFIDDSQKIITERRFKSFIVITPDSLEDKAIDLAGSAAEAGFNGIVISGGVTRDKLRVYGGSTKESGLSTLKNIRTAGPNLFIIASGGIIEPADAIEYLQAGANMVQLYSGLVYSGPGLPTRINELCAHLSDCDSTKPVPPKTYSSPYTFKSVLKAGGWLGFACLGVGVLISCSSAITVGLTSVVLPYDEKFLGVTRDTMNHMNSNLLPFMSHDRVTYAGSSLSCGLLFLALSFFGARLGQKWAYKACLYSTCFGTFSFLLFLGFHYLDPLHMLVTVLLVPFWAWGFFAKPKFVPMRGINAHNTKAWRNALVGQLLFVCIGLGLLLAGCTICYVGTHGVFVAEDLMFMHTSAQELLSHNSHLLPAIAHDRAGFGATLVTAGIAVLGTALHGFRQGEGWVWWMLLISGLPGFVSTLAIHMHIGYTSMVHLLPAYIASLMFAFGLIYSYRYLCVESAPN